MKELNVLHIASFNGNIGDNANHNGLRSKLEEHLSIEINYTEIEMREFYRSWNIRDFNDRKFIDLCNQHDLVIIGGGNFFELKWDYSYTGTTINISESTLRSILTPIFFFGLGCDVAKGASKSAINKFSNFLQNVTNSKKYLVSVRNDGSYNTIKRLYGNKFEGKIFKVIDGGFFISTKTSNYHELNLKGQKYKSIGINIVSDMKEIRFREELTYDEFLRQFAGIINDFLEKHNDYRAILFPHIFSDLEAVYKFISLIDDRYRRTRIVVAPLLTGGGSEDYIFGLYKECDVILGMRFHSNVCSIAQNIPTIALSSYQKIHDLYLELGLLDRVIDVNDTNFSEKTMVALEKTLDINELEQIRMDYQKLNQKLELEANLFFLQLKEWAIENNLL